MVAQGQSHILSDAFRRGGYGGFMTRLSPFSCSASARRDPSRAGKIAMRRILLADDEQIIDFM